MNSRITEGLRDAVAFAGGDKSKGRVTRFQVDGSERSNRLLKQLESIGGEPLEGSGHEDDEPDPTYGAPAAPATR